MRAIASRRTAEELIEEGRVKVGGRTITDLPVWVDPAHDIVEIDGRRISGVPERPVYVMLHKPRRCVCTVLDPEGTTHRRRSCQRTPPAHASTPWGVSISTPPASS